MEDVIFGRFIESLSHKQTKLIRIGALKPSKPYALTMKDDKKKDKQKIKDFDRIDGESIESSKEIERENKEQLTILEDFYYYYFIFW